MLELFIAGTPAPQGSKNAFRRGSRISLVEANKNLPAWREQVIKQLQKLNETNGIMYEGAVYVSAHFYINRPKSNKRTYPTTKPDTDKLIRAIGDCLTKAMIIQDDSYVIEWSARKSYADTMPTGVLLTIETF
jgi:crossover junction endodeoxyribonuclease RusA